MSDASHLSMSIVQLETQPSPHGYQSVNVHTSRGTINGRYFEAPGTTHAAIFVGGAGGGWDSPAHGLYDRLCISLPNAGIAALRLRYRKPNDLLECSLDVLAGLAFLETRKIKQTALIGHSFGGAVVISAASVSPSVQTVLALSTQTYGATSVIGLAHNCSILLIHGKEDRILHHSCSEYVYDLAREPKELVLFEGTGHGLDEAAEAIEERISTWVIKTLRPQEAQNE